MDATATNCRRLKQCLVATAIVAGGCNGPHSDRLVEKWTFPGGISRAYPSYLEIRPGVEQGEIWLRREDQIVYQYKPSQKNLVLLPGAAWPKSKKAYPACNGSISLELRIDGEIHSANLRGQQIVLPGDAVSTYESPSGGIVAVVSAKKVTNDLFFGGETPPHFISFIDRRNGSEVRPFVRLPFDIGGTKVCWLPDESHIVAVDGNLLNISVVPVRQKLTPP